MAEELRNSKLSIKYIYSILFVTDSVLWQIFFYFYVAWYHLLDNRSWICFTLDIELKVSLNYFREMLDINIASCSCIIFVFIFVCWTFICIWIENDENMMLTCIRYNINCILWPWPLYRIFKWRSTILFSEFTI